MRILYLALGALLLSTSLAQGQPAQEGGAVAETPLWSQANQYFDPQAMDAARERVLHHAGNQLFAFAMIDRFELQTQGGEDQIIWDAQGYVGGDLNKFYLKSGGAYSLSANSTSDAELQALWSRAISSFFDVQAGLRYDLEPDHRAHAVVGVQGLAPYLFEIDAAAFFSENGDLTARTEIEYKFLLTQRLILQPQLEANFSAQDIAERALGRGLTDMSVGVRLRYDIRREFSPYFGVEWQQAYGDTADLIESGGGDAEGIGYVIGFRAWF